MIPLFGFLEHDTIGLLVMAYPEDTMAQLIQKLQYAARLRVKPQVFMQLKYKNQILSPDLKVQEIEFQPLDYFFVFAQSQEDIAHHA